MCVCVCVCIYIHIYESHCCTSQSNTMLLSTILQKKIKFKNPGIVYSYLLTNLESNIESKTFQHKAREEILANNISDKKFLLLIYKKLAAD